MVEYNISLNEWIIFFLTDYVKVILLSFDTFETF